MGPCASKPAGDTPKVDRVPETISRNLKTDYVSQKNPNPVTNTNPMLLDKKTQPAQQADGLFNKAVNLAVDFEDIDKAIMEAIMSKLEGIESRLGTIESKMAGGTVVPAAAAPVVGSSAGGGSSGGGGPSAPSVAAFDTLIASHVDPLVAKSASCGSEVADITKILLKAFQEERKIVEAISKCKTPTMQELQQLAMPLGEAVAEANKKADGKRTDAFNHFKAVAESLQALFWVVYTGPSSGMSLPIPMVDESWQSAEFYANKILREYRGKDESHVEWIKALKQLVLVALKDYVKQFHTTGPSWNNAGGSVSSFSSSGAAASSGPPAAPPPPSAGSGPPPPPPPPPPGSLTQPRPATGGGKSGMTAVFNELNKGDAVTAGLKKVTDDMKSKNQAQRTGAVPAAASSGSTAGKKTTAAPAAAAKKMPKCALEGGRKWVVENQVDNREIVISDCNSKQTVYIYNCQRSVIQIQGKVNSIAMDKCSRTGLVFQDVVAACEAVNCQSVEVQCSKSVPTIVVDNCSGCQIYLSETSKSTTITTAKSSEVNVLTPGASADADMEESPLPEQFSSTFENGKWVTVPVMHSAG